MQLDWKTHEQNAVGYFLILVPLNVILLVLLFFTFVHNAQKHFIFFDKVPTLFMYKSGSLGILILCYFIICGAPANSVASKVKQVFTLTHINYYIFIVITFLFKPSSVKPVQ